MRYLILRPVSPTDPRHLAIESLPHLHELFPLTVECSLEEEAVESVRAMYPDAIAMPVPFRVGSGEMFLLGILASIATRPNGNEDINSIAIPFVLLVQAVAEDAIDRRTLKDRKQFTSRAWQPPVVDPAGSVARYVVELRASDLATPVRTHATVGTHDGKLAIRCAIGGVAMSITFEDPSAVLLSDSGSSGERG
jgi:hypothetical protein